MLGYSLLVGIILQINRIKTSATQILVNYMLSAALAIREVFMWTPTNLRVTTVIQLYPSLEIK